VLSLASTSRYLAVLDLRTQYDMKPSVRLSALEALGIGPAATAVVSSLGVGDRAHARAELQLVVGIWRWNSDLHIDMTPRAPFQLLYMV
jgi:hypothetical protein